MITKVEDVKLLVVSAEKGTEIEDIIELVERAEKGLVIQATKIDSGASLEMMAAQRKMFQIAKGPLGIGRLAPDEDAYYLVQVLKPGSPKYANEVKKQEKERAKKAELRDAELKVANAQEKIDKAADLEEQLRMARVEADEAAIEAGLKDAVEEAYIELDE